MAIERIIPRGFMSLSEYIDDIVGMAAKAAHGPVKSPIQWSARQWDPNAQELASYGPSAGRVLNFFDYLENAPREALLIGESAPSRLVRDASNLNPSGGPGIYFPHQIQEVVGMQRNTAPTLAQANLGRIYGSIPQDDRAARVEASNNIRSVVNEILKSRLGLENVRGYKNTLAGIAEGLSDVDQTRFGYQVLTTPAEAGLIAAQSAERLGPDFLNAIATIAADPRAVYSVTPTRILSLANAGNFGPEVVTQAISNILGRGDTIRGVTLQDEIFKLLGKENLRQTSGTDVSSLAKKVAQSEERMVEKLLNRNVDDYAGVPTAKTPEVRRMNQLLNRLLTDDEKAGLQYLTPDQLGEFIQKVLRERAPGYGG